MPGPSLRRMSRWTLRLRQHSARNITACPAELPPPTTATSASRRNIGLNRSAGVIDAGPRESLGPLGLQPPPADAQG